MSHNDRPSSHPRNVAPTVPRGAAALGLGILVVLAGCRDEPAALEPEPEPEPEVVDTPVGEYLEALPSWSAFSPPLPPQEPAPVDGAMALETEETVPAVAVYDEEGDIEVLGDITYDCTEVPFSMGDDPAQVIITDPNRDVLYPGAFIQGRTYRDGISIGDVLPLTINERAPVRVSIPDVSNPDTQNFREVQPNQAEVAEAVGNIIGNATRDDLHTPSSISFEMQSFHSDKQFALSAGVSARYLGFKGSASGSVEKNAATTTVAVQFTQRMFTVVVEPPGAGAESFFADDFTAEDLQTHVDAGRIGPDNLPVYVSSVVYGRMMTFAMTSTASESQIRAALRASYDTIAGSISGKVDAKHEAVLAESSVVLTTLGGDAADALGVIRSGDWSAYFSNEAALSTAVPLSYTFKNLGDNSIASVSETTDYTVKTCEARQATAGVFEPLEVQPFELGMDAVSEIIAADTNGDGYDDLVFNGRGAANQVAILRGGEDGGFRPMPLWTHPSGPAAASWSQYQVQSGDIDGDGDDDLVWNQNGACTPVDTCMGNTFHAALADSAAGPGESPLSSIPAQQTVHPQFDGSSYPFALADINGDGLADPVVHSSDIRRDTGHFFVHAGLSRGDGTFALSEGPEVEDSQAGGVTDNFLADAIADFDGDGKADILWSRLTGVGDGSAYGNNLNTFASRVDASLPPDTVDFANIFELWGAPDLPPPVAPAPRWEEHRLLVGDVDADGAQDLVWVAYDDGTVTTHFARGGGGNGFVGDEQAEFVLSGDAAPETVDAKLADVAGNDQEDLIVNQREGAVNRIFVGLSRGDGSFDDTVAVQTIAAEEPWSQFELITGNFGGSDKQDLAWVVRTNETRIYVAIAR